MTGSTYAGVLTVVFIALLFFLMTFVMTFAGNGFCFNWMP